MRACFQSRYLRGGLPLFKTKLFEIGRILLWSVIPAIIITLSLEALSGRPLAILMAWTQSGRPPFPVSVLLISSLLLALNALTARPVISLLVGGAPLLGLAAVSGEKLRYLTQPLFPWDLMSIRQIADLLPVLIKDASIKRAIIGLVVFGVFLVVLFIARRILMVRSRISWPVRGVAFAAAAVPLSILVYSVLTVPSPFSLKAFGIVNQTWNQNLNHNNNGFLLAFLGNVQSAIIRDPSDYARDKLPAVLETVMGPNRELTPVQRKDNATAPNVVIVMSEAFWDPTFLPSVQYSEDPLKFFHDLHGKQKQNYFMSPAFAGGTANVEFEALTGFSNAFLPSGSIPYQQYLTRPVPSLASFFASMGYDTAAIHTYHGWFWNRNKVYQHFGFNKFIDIESFKTAPRKGPYIADAALTDRILDEIKEGTQPKFIFAVSMENHSPYAPGRYDTNKVKVSSSTLSPDLSNMLEVYTQGVYDADRALADLVKGIEASGEPTLVLFFGDHLPFLGPNLDVYLRTGFYNSTEPNPLIKLRRNPFVMWSNFNAPTDGTLMSPSFAPVLITRALGMKHPFYTDFLGGVMEDWPVVGGELTQNKSGAVTSFEAVKTSPKLKAYQWVQHDLMFGREYSAPVLFGSSKPLNSAAAAQ